MRRIRLTVAYDGTDYCGWQVQNNVSNETQGLIMRAEDTYGRREKNQ